MIFVPGTLIISVRINDCFTCTDHQLEEVEYAWRKPTSDFQTVRFHVHVTECVCVCK